MSDQSSQEPVTRELQTGSVAPISSVTSRADEGAWTRRLVIYLRVMAAVAVCKGLYHWAEVTGFIGTDDSAFDVQPMSWQAATIYFAVIELVAAIGLWLATPWGAVVWLTSVVSMAVIELMFPNIYGGPRAATMIMLARVVAANAGRTSPLSLQIPFSARTVVTEP